MPGALPAPRNSPPNPPLGMGAQLACQQGGPPWWTAGVSGRSLVAPSCGGSAGVTSWALPARLWAAPRRPGRRSAQHRVPSLASLGAGLAAHVLGAAQGMSVVLGPSPAPQSPAFPGAGNALPRGQGGRKPSPHPMRAGAPRARGRALTRWKYFSVSKSFTVRGKTQ